MSSFQDLWIKLVYNNPEAEDRRSFAQLALNYKTERVCSLPTAHNSSGLLPQGYCERVEKTTSSVLSVISINPVILQLVSLLTIYC